MNMSTVAERKREKDGTEEGICGTDKGQKRTTDDGILRGPRGPKKGLVSIFTQCPGIHLINSIII